MQKLYWKYLLFESLLIKNYVPPPILCDLIDHHNNFGNFSPETYMSNVMDNISYVAYHTESCTIRHGLSLQFFLSNTLFFRCVPCQCYGHSDSCDPATGICSCQDNTIGDNCDTCKEGFYGNPTEGTKDDCKPCPCKFGSRCILIGKNIVCTDCPEGHTGSLCEYCQDGYYGDPSGILGFATRCQKCNCSGNIDFNAIGNCNSLTGDCLKCIYNTRNGPLERCEQCAIGFHGNATEYPKPQCVGM